VGGISICIIRGPRNQLPKRRGLVKEVKTDIVRLWNRSLKGSGVGKKKEHHLKASLGVILKAVGKRRDTQLTVWCLSGKNFKNHPGGKAKKMAESKMFPVSSLRITSY